MLDQPAIYAGPSLNLLDSELRKEAGVIPAFWSRTNIADEHIALSIDFSVGIQWEPKFGKLNRLPPINRKPEPDAQPKAEPKTEPNVEPQAKPTVEPQAEPKAEPDVEPQAEPNVEPQAEPDVEPQAEPNVEPQAEPDVEL